MLLAFLAETAAQTGNALPSPWGELTAGGILTIGIIVVWRVNTKLASRNEELHVRIAEIQEQRAKEGIEETRAMTQALGQSTQAVRDMTHAVENNNRLLERLLNGEPKRS